MIDQRISKFMNRHVLCGGPDTPLGTVFEQMLSRGQDAFVVREEGEPIGMITSRDAIEILGRSFAGATHRSVVSSSVMTTPVQTLPENATMGELIQVIRAGGFRHVPIVDDKGRLSGIVDLLAIHDATINALERRGRDLEVAVMARTADLQAANAKLPELSIRDGLTGLFNRRAMEDKLSDLHGLAVRYGNAYSVAIVDIDHFKNYNDRLGHIAGDDAIIRISRLLACTIRESDSVYRYGVEEFLIAMPETEAEGASFLAERIRRSVRSAAIVHPDSSVGSYVTISLGYAGVKRQEVLDHAGWEDVVGAADRALYRAKETGRNRCVMSNAMHRGPAFTP
jgi:diguanylate cyclase (GGDEF)-like protein